MKRKSATISIHNPIHNLHALHNFRVFRKNWGQTERLPIRFVEKLWDLPSVLGFLNINSHPLFTSTAESALAGIAALVPVESAPGFLIREPSLGCPAEPAVNIYTS